jgi:4-alpha-glucanotransferase
MSGLRERARAAGVAPDWIDVRHQRHAVPERTLAAVLDALAAGAAPGPAPLATAERGQACILPGPRGRFRLEAENGAVHEGIAEEAGGGTVSIGAVARAGYHLLELADGSTVRLAVVPEQCWTIGDATGGRPAWGLAAQLYGLRRPGDGGLGDFAALAQLAREAGRAGAAAVAISPVHALSAADPTQFSPYFPSSRLMLNVLHAAPPAPLPGGEGGLVDWPAAAAARLAAWRDAFAALEPEQRDALAAFRRERGTALERHARFEALREAQPGGWPDWPAGLHAPDAPAVADFAARHAEAVDFHAFLQFMADRGLAAAQGACLASGMPIGLITDLAVGVSAGGSDAWTRQGEILAGVSVGAPPDIGNPHGQDWGVAAFSPSGLRAHGYGAFLDMLRGALRHAGGVRIDHAMGLCRLWVIPKGAAPAEGAYLTMPERDLLRLVRLESWRHRAIVLGEDLGTLPDGFRDRLAAAGIAGMRVLWFERDGTAFAPPAAWGGEAVAMTSTHDLPTVAGWWAGSDLRLREQLGPGDARPAERAALWHALRASGAARGAMPDDPQAVVDAAVAHLARAACPLAILPLEDALGLEEQPNLPGADEAHPNWRRRMAADAQDMLAAPRVAARLAALREARP